MKNTAKIILSLVVVGAFLLSGFGVAAQAPGIHIVNLSKPRAVESYVVESTHPYTNNYDYTWTITKSGASKIRIHFTSDTEVENNYDFLYLYNGGGNQIWKKTGAIGTFWTDWVNGDTVKVRLTTDYSVTKYGFKVDQREYETTSSDIELTSGIAYSGSLSATGDVDYYKINVPSGSTKLDVVLDGPSSGCDFDLYVKYNQRPTTSSYDGRGYTSSADETVTINSPSTGYYYIMPYSYSGSGTYTIKATVTGGGGDTTPPTISSVQASSITSSGVTITWTTNEASSSVVEYGTTTSYGSTATGSSGVTSHSVGLSSLSAGTTYHYRVKSTDGSGNTATSSDYTFTTSSTSSDIELSSGVAYSESLSATGNMDYYKINIPSGSTKLDVVLDGPSSGCDFDLYVKYNQRPTTSSYDGRGYTSSADETVTINSPSTGYYYIMPYSYSGSGSYTIKATVTGGGGDTTPPTISNVQASSITNSGATITWTTNEASNSVVEYGTSTSYGSTATGSSGVTSHSVSLSGLSAGTTYHYRVKSTDSSGNTATSSDYTFTTSSTSSDIELTSGVAYSESLSATGDKDYYKINVPSGSTKLEVILDGPSSGCDFDLYVKYNQRPTTSSYDGRGYTSSADETVTINSPSTGYYYIMPYSYSGSGTYTIKATVTGGGSGTGGKYAVIVGINDYQYISDLSYCVNDANDWKGYLQGQGYTISSFLTNSQATETAIKNAIANVISQAGSTGTVAFIFSGHGGKYSEAGLSGTGSVCYCYDGSTSSGTSGNLQDTELQSCFSGYTGKLFIFLDSCRSGGMNEVMQDDSANRYMATTCGPNGYGYDEPSYLNGAWTYWFLEKGLVNSGSGHTDMEGNFNWAKNNYPYSGDDAPMQFDGDTSSLFYL